MAIQRRRLHQPRCPIPSASSFALPALLLLAVLSLLAYLAPPLVDDPPTSGDGHRQLDHPKPRNSSGGLEAEVAAKKKSAVKRIDPSSKIDLWESKLSKYHYGCSNASNTFEDAEAITYPDRFLMIATSGGLNQQRTGITDAVVAARILNATLVVPNLDQRSFWKDSSNFGEIFDVDWFISFLSKDVKIIKELSQIPQKGGEAIRGPYTMRVPRKCTPRCYETRVLPVLLKKHVVRLTKFDYRLANRLNHDLQKLRCRVNYHSLRFTDPIQAMGDKLIHRMKEKGKHFIALHLRFEPDMLAFSGCYYGGGEKEMRELGAIRKRWKTLHTSNPEKERRHGRCPLTPEEVGLMLKALGYGADTHIYVASGEIYGGEDTLAPLKTLFPNFHSKETLASEEELSPFSSFSSRMAAVDFIVCDGSDAFVTNNNGNMAKILAGRRRYFGHKRTIRPNSRKLYSLFLRRGNITWEEFASKVHIYQRGFMGEPKEIRPGRGEFHENPSTCICDNAVTNTSSDSGLQRSRDTDTMHEKNNPEKDIGDLKDDNPSNEDPDWPDLDDGEDELPGKQSLNDTDEYDSFIRPNSDLEEMMSD